MPLLISLFFLSGFNALVFEVVWTRSLSLLLGSTTEAVVMVTSAFMLGLGLGALNWRRVLGSRQPLRAFVGLELGIALVGGAVTLLLPQLAPFFGRYLT